MKAASRPAPERGLLILIALALLATGVVFHTTRERPVPLPAPTPILIENVRIVRPVFRDAKPLDLNRATHRDLVELPGIGDVLAGRILEYRDAHGAFRSIDELLDVNGIGPTLLDGLRDRVTVDLGGASDVPQ